MLVLPERRSYSLPPTDGIQNRLVVILNGAGIVVIHNLAALDARAITPQLR